MQAFLIRRLATLPLLLLGISIISFTLLNLAPGDPAYIVLKHQQQGEEPSVEAVRELRRQWRLDDPIVLRSLPGWPGWAGEIWGGPIAADCPS